MSHHVETDIEVQKFGFVDDDNGRRLVFPHAETTKVEGRTATAGYGLENCLFEALESRLGTVRWTASAASIGGAWMRDDAGRYEITVDRVELPKGVLLTRAETGVEVVAPHVSFSEMRFTFTGPFSREPADPLVDPIAAAAAAATAAAAAAAAPPSPDEPAPLRQDRLHFLDSLTGKINLTVKVVLDLPVIKRRSLDQTLKVPIEEGSLDFRKLDDSLDWLEGTFLDISHSGDKLALQWKMPIIGGGRDLISWKLDDQAATLASFGRVPLRSLADFRLRKQDKAAKADDKRKTLQSLSLNAIDVVLSLLAPRSLEIGDGLIMFGGDDQPGMVDMKVTGDINDRGPGKLSGAIGSIDTTIKDLGLGSSHLSVDRLHFDGLDQLEVTFDGWKPTKVTVLVARVTATNLVLGLGSRPKP